MHTCNVVTTMFYLYLHTGLEVQFSLSAYSIAENAEPMESTGQLDVCVLVSGIPLSGSDRDFSVFISTMSGTAEGNTHEMTVTMLCIAYLMTIT